MKRLFRKRNSSIGGVCSGISEFFDVDVTIIRILFVCLIFTSFPIIISYLIMWYLIPKEEI